MWSIDELIKVGQPEILKQVRSEAKVILKTRIPVSYTHLTLPTKLEV